MRKAARIAWPLAVLLALLPASVEAGDRFDPVAWLSRARTRVLVVEFFATHCPPCMEAVPKWKALHERYRSDGLRLAVVSVQDQDFGCKQLPWNPDYTVCDDRGDIHARMSPSRNLPMAFAWSWRGELIAQSGHVGAVSKAVKTYLSSAQKVVVEGADKALRKEVEQELAARGKLIVVLSEKEQRRLRKLQKQAASLRRRQTKCRLGEELSANMRLEVSRRQFDGQLRLHLGLQSIDRGCLVGGASVSWDRRNPGGSVSEAVDALLDKLRLPFQWPGKARAPVQPRPALRRQAGSLFVEVNVAGVTLSIDGQAAGQPLQAKKLRKVSLPFRERPYIVGLTRPDHVPYRAEVLLSPSRPTYMIEHVMAPVVTGGDDAGVGVLDIHSKPSGAGSVAAPLRAVPGPCGHRRAAHVPSRAGR